MELDAVNARKSAFLAAARDDPGLEDDDPGGARGTLRDVVARQIDGDDPPEVWQTALRLEGLGLVAGDVLHQLVLTLGTHMAAAFESGQLDEGAYREALERLPLPTPDEIERAFVDVVREQQPVAAEEVARSVIARLGLPDDELTERLLDHVEEELIDGPLAMLAPDRLVHVPSMLDGVVLTHRLTDEEHRSGVLHGTDLPGFGRDGLTWHGEDVVYHRGEDGATRWLGPSGWLDELRPGALLAVRVDVAGAVSLTSLDVEPAAQDGLVAALRSAYDADVEEPWLPVAGAHLLLTVLAADRAAFARPVPPLSELAAAAGLEQRYERYAHDASVWRHSEKVVRQHRILDRLGHGEAARSAVRALSLVEESAAQGDVAAAREVLDDLYDPSVLETVAGELLGVDDDPTALADFTALSGRLLAAASRPRQWAVAGWLAALADERRGRVLDAESHLRQAVREDPGWPCVEDRMAWYEADRGDAAAAVARWRRMGDTAEDNQDLETVTRFAAAEAAPRLGRNERCWCGSGRKYKACHLGAPAHARLPDRVNWLCRKPVAYLERRIGMGPTVLDHAAARAGVPNDPGDPDSVAAMTEALQDPLVLDTVLHESGWFARFLSERGPLLPDDEAMLAQSWILVERSVHEVLDVTPGVGLVLRDLRTGDRHDVRERSFSRQAHSGALVCARVVPDGESHALIGGLFGMAPGTETGLLDLLEQRDGYALLHYVCLLHRPPTLVTTDGDPLVDCRADLEVPDPEAARAELDRRYEPDGDGWVLFADADVTGSRTVRGWLRMTGSVLSVRTMSESRLDAACAELLVVLPAARVTGDERRPFERGEVPADTAIPGGTPPGAAVPPEIPREALLEIVDRQERSWCDEPVPALGGRTPRDAAGDPTRREELARLIASFPDIDPDDGMVAMRPERLRELLGLSAHRPHAEK